MTIDCHKPVISMAALMSRHCAIVLAVMCAASCGALVLAQGFAPSKVEGHLSAVDGVKVKAFRREPMVRQAIFVKCDDRGRLWTIQYLQYPNPAGLKRVKVDRWSRTVYDRVPSRRRAARAAPTALRS